MSEFEQQVAEALLTLPMPRRSHSVEVVRNILAPRVAAAIHAAMWCAVSHGHAADETAALAALQAKK